jgi:hypothetical protein
MGILYPMRGPTDELHIRLPVAVSEQLRQLAELEVRTINAQIVVALTEWLKGPGAARLPSRD